MNGKLIDFPSDVSYELGIYAIQDLYRKIMDSEEVILSNVDNLHVKMNPKDLEMFWNKIKIAHKSEVDLQYAAIYFMDNCPTEDISIPDGKIFLENGWIYR